MWNDSGDWVWVFLYVYMVFPLFVSGPILRDKDIFLGVVAYAFNPSNGEIGAGE